MVLIIPIYVSDIWYSYTLIFHFKWTLNHRCCIYVFSTDIFIITRFLQSSPIISLNEGFAFHWNLVFSITVENLQQLCSLHNYSTLLLKMLPRSIFKFLRALIIYTNLLFHLIFYILTVIWNLWSVHPIKHPILSTETRKIISMHILHFSIVREFCRTMLTTAPPI